MAAFAQFTSRSIGKTNLDELMLDACFRARAGIGMSHAKLLEYIPERDRLIMRAGVGWKEGYVGSYEVSSSLDTPIGHAFAFSEPVSISDYSQSTGYRYPALLADHGPRQHDAQSIELHRSLNALNRTLDEKQLFAREMNHRIKNNLSLVGAILALHSRRIPDLAARDEIQNAIQRINNLALVHDRLQMFGQLDAQIDAQAHFAELAVMLRSLLPPSVRLTTKCSGSLPGDCVESLPLIANELITNAAKYAFESRDEGEIIIGFRQEGPGWRFFVQDAIREAGVRAMQRKYASRFKGGTGGRKARQNR